MDSIGKAAKQLAESLFNSIPGDLFGWVSGNFFAGSIVEWVTASATAFAVVFGAEFGDKSQIVCMTLAAQHRALPVILGATGAFAVLNLGAVSIGAAVAMMIPEKIPSLVVAFLFLFFGIHALLAEHDEEVDEVQKSGRGIFATTFLLIFMAEFGDKTQIAMAGLSSALLPAAVWVGGTLALSVTSALGAWAGRAVMQRFPIYWMHRIGGLFFLLLSGLALWRTLSIE